MADPRFFRRAGPFTLSQLAEAVGADLGPGTDPERRLSDVAAVDAAGPDCVSFLDNPKYVGKFRESGAGACVVAPGMVQEAPAGMGLLVTPEPYLAYARIAAMFYPAPEPAAGISAAAVVADDAQLGPDCRIEAGVVVEGGAEIGARCRIGPGAVIGAGVVLGDDCVVGANAVVSHAVIGARVRLYPGACIGQRGFGFALDMTRPGFVDVPQLGRVVIEDDVEIGANTCVDRGASGDTVIGAGTRIDNLVQIGHNVRIGRMCAIAAQVGFAGSTTVGDFVRMGGQSGVAGHLTIGVKVEVAGQAGIIGDVSEGETVMGFPARPRRTFLRMMARLERLTRTGAK